MGVFPCRRFVAGRRADLFGGVGSFPGEGVIFTVLQFLFQEELESSEDDAFSWVGADSSEEIGSSSSDDTAAGGNPLQFLKAPMEGSEEGSSSSGGRSNSSTEDDGNSSTEDDGSSSGDNDDDDGGDAPSRSPKRRRCSDTYDW